MCDEFTNGEEGFCTAGLRGSVFGVISPLPLSLSCCHMLSDTSKLYATHSYPCACLFVYLFICLLFLFMPPPPLSRSLNPLLPQSICCQKHPEYLSASLFAFSSSHSSKREGAGQLTFPATWYTHAHIQKGI